MPPPQAMKEQGTMYSYLLMIVALVSLIEHLTADRTAEALGILMLTFLMFLHISLLQEPSVTDITVEAFHAFVNGLESGEIERIIKRFHHRLITVYGHKGCFD